MKKRESTGKAQSKRKGKDEGRRMKDEGGAGPAPVQGEVLPVPLGEIGVSPFQTRAAETEEDLAGLAASIRASGMLNPLTVRRAKPDAPSGVRWELVCGHRRLAAARMAGLLTAPCVALKLDDGAAMLANVVENLQRKDLSPLEEADGVAALTGGGRTAPEIARLLGVSERWVFRRRKLAAIVPAWRKIIREAKCGQVFCENMAALPKPLQRLLLDTDLARRPDHREIGRALWTAGARDIERMPWKEKHPDWCGGCANAVNNLDSGGEGIATDRWDLENCRFCGNPACQREKTAAWVRERYETIKSLVPPGLPPPRKVKHAHDVPWDKGIKPDKKRTAAYLVTDGPEAGRVYWCFPEKPLTPAKEKEPPPEIPGRRESLARISAIHRLVADGKEEKPISPLDSIALALHFLTNWHQGQTAAERLAASNEMSLYALSEALGQNVRGCFPRFLDKTRFLTKDKGDGGLTEEAEWVARCYGITEDEIAAEIKKEGKASSDGDN